MTEGPMPKMPEDHRFARRFAPDDFRSKGHCTTNGR